MAKREWRLNFTCGHERCVERSNWCYQTRRDMMESFEMKHYSNGRWRCVRHSDPEAVLSESNPRTTHELTVEARPYGRYFGNQGFISGPGFKAFASDFPPGTRLIVRTEIVFPTGKDPTQ